MPDSFNDQIVKAVYKKIAPKIHEALEEAIAEKLFRDFDVVLLKPLQELGNMSFALVEPFDISREVGRLDKSASLVDRVVGFYLRGLYRKDGKIFSITPKERQILVQRIKQKLGR